MPEFDTLIKGGTVIDGLMSGRFVSDIGIKDGRITSIAGRIPASSATTVLDAGGLIVAPGFIDLHTHYDSQIYWDPWCTISGWHGVTSVGIGNCGFGFAPCRPADRDRAMLTMSRNEAVPLETMKEGMPWDWETFPQFLDSLDRTAKGVNVLAYQPLAPLMSYVMGGDDAKGRPATDAERLEMCRLLEESMDAGSCGWSAQLFGSNSIQRDFDGTPMITDTMAEADLLAFAAVLRKVGRGFIQGIGATRDLWEKLSEVSGRPIIYNVVALTTDQHGVANETYRSTLDWIADANQRGHRIYGQAVTTEIAFEFTLATWNLFDSSPVWRVVTLGGPEDRLVRMKDPEMRQALRDELDNAGEDGMRNFSSVIGAVSPPSRSTREATRHEEGLRGIHRRRDRGPRGQACDRRPARSRRRRQPRDHVQHAAAAVRARTDARAGQLELRHPGISDGGAHTKFMTFGAYPTEFLTKVARDDELVSLEHAHWSLSALPAMAAGFRDRGFIREGMPADLVVYDLDRLQMGPQEKAWDYPADEWRQVRTAVGYRWIMVNGSVTFEEGTGTGAVPGKLLRHGMDEASSI